MGALRQTIPLFLLLFVIAETNLVAQVNERTDATTPGFVENGGQWGEEVLFRYTTLGGDLHVTRSGLDILLTGKNDAVHLLQWRVRGVTAIDLVGVDRQPDHYRRGVISGDRYRAIGSYAEVHANQILPGIDLQVALQDASPKYQFVCSPGSDPSSIHVEYRGAASLDVDSHGRLVVGTSVGQLLEERPVAWQLIEGATIPVDVRFVVEGDETVRFEICGYDRSLPLIIDPAIRFSTYLGGDGNDVGRSVVTGKDGSIYVVGSSFSFDFPTTPGAYDRSRDSLGGSRDVFVSKFDPTGGRLLWSTWISGGGNDDPIAGARVAADGHLILAGVTSSADFPFTPGVLQETHGGGVDGFIAKLDSNGSRLLWSTFYGGAEDDSLASFGTDLQGDIVLAGSSRSGLTFPEGNYQATNAGGSDIFGLRISPDGGQVRNGSWVGDVGDEHATDMAVGPGGESYITGSSRSDFFPTSADAISTTRSGGLDGVALQFSFDFRELTWSTYIGGSADDTPFGIAIDTAVNVLITGETNSADYPNDVVGVDSGSWFASSFRKRDRGLEYSRIVSEDTLSVGYDALFDRSGRPLLIGSTRSSLFPTSANARKIGSRGGENLALIRLSTNGRGVERAAVVGGSLNERPAAQAWLLTEGEVVVTGQTRSADLPLSRFPFDTLRNVESLSSAEDAFLIGWQFDERKNLTGPTTFFVDTLFCATRVLDTFFVYNDGEAPLEIFANQLKQSNSPFRLVEPADLTSIILLPGDSLRYIVEYSESGVGPTTNEVQIFNSDSVGGRSPLIVPLVGTRAAPSIVAVPSALQFGPVETCGADTMVLSLRNNGVGTVTVESPTVVGGPVFSVDPAVTFPLTLREREQVEVPVVFDPVDPIGYAGSVRFTIEECAFSLLDVELGGRGAEIAVGGLPDSIDLGEIPACESSVDSLLLVVNNGDLPLPIHSLIGDQPDIVVIEPAGPVTLEPGDTLRLHVRISPSVTGEVVRTLTMEAGTCDTLFSVKLRLFRNEASIPVPRTLSLDFGLLTHCLPGALFAERSLTIDNPSAEVVMLDDPVFTAPFEAGGLGFPSEIEPNGSVTYQLRFIPVAEGLSNGSFKLLFRSGSCVDTIVVTLRGEYRRPALVPLLDTVDLGPLGPCAAEAPISVALRSQAVEEMTIESLLLPSGVDYNGPDLPLQVAAGEIASLDLTVAPRASGPFTFRTRAVVGPCGDTVDIVLTGSAEGVVVAADRDSLPFPPALACSPPRFQHDTVKISWSGTTGAPVVVRSVRLRGPRPSPFSVEDSASLVGREIGEGEDLPVRVGFGSSDFDDYVDTLELVLEPCGDTILIPLTGSSRFPSLSITNPPFGQVEVQTSLTRQIIIGNESGVPLELNLRGLPGDPYEADTTGLNLPRLLAPEEVIVIPVTFSPEFTGQETDSLLLSLVAGCAYPRAVRLDGEGVNPVLEAEFCIRGTYLQPGGAGDTVEVEIQGDRPLTLPSPVDLNYIVRFDPARVEIAYVVGGALESVDLATGQATISAFGLQSIPDDLPSIGLRLLAGKELFTLVGLDSAIVVGGASLRPRLCDTSAVVSISTRCLISGVSLGTFANRIVPARPNPVENRLELTFQQLEDATTTILIFDAGGREVLRPVEAPMRGGRYTIEVDVSTLPAGLYVVSIAAGSWHGTSQFLKR